MIPESITPPYSHDLNQPSVPDVAPMGPTPPPSIPADHALCLIGWHPRLILVPGVLRLWETSFFPHHPWASPGRSPPSNPSWEDAHPWESSFSSQSRGFPASWVPLPINYFREDVHPWEMLPRLFPLPATYPGHFATPPLFVPSCMYLFIANIFDL